MPLVHPLGCPLLRAGHALLPHHDLGAIGGDPFSLARSSSSTYYTKIITLLPLTFAWNIIPCSNS
jgi:hypothetical protein